MIYYETVDLVKYYNDVSRPYLIPIDIFIMLFLVPLTVVFLITVFKRFDRRQQLLWLYITFILSLFLSLCIYKLEEQQWTNELPDLVVSKYNKCVNKDRVLSDLENDELMKNETNYLKVRNIIKNYKA